MLRALRATWSRPSHYLTGKRTVRDAKKSRRAPMIEQLENRILLCGAPPCNGPDITIDDVTLNETSNTQKFTVTLSESSENEITVDYATANDTAIAGTDYTSTSGTLTFDPYETTMEIDVPILSDSLDEDDETFFVDLSNASEGSITDSQGVGTISDDDAAPSISVNDPTVGEGGSLSFTVSLSAASGQDVTVDYATSDGTATSPDDFTALSSTELTFTAGQTSKSVNVTLVNDTLDENNETLDLDLSNAFNATIADATGTATITDDDATPTMTIADESVSESGTSVQFTVSLSQQSGRSITVDYDTADGTATTANSEYTSASGTLTFNTGDTTKTFTVNVTSDTDKESDETFKVDLSNATNVTVTDSQALGTIVDDDATGMTNTLDAFTSGGNPIHAGNVMTAYSLPSGLQLVYNTLTDGLPIIVVETVQPENSAVPDKIKAELTFDSVTETAVYYSTTGLSAGDPLRFVLQADASSLATGTYVWEVKLTEEHGSNISTRTFTGTRSIVNRRSSEFGSHWWVSGLDHLAIDGNDVALVKSNAGTVWFEEDEGAHAGPEWVEDVLTKNGDGSYTLDFKNGGSTEFNSSGQLTERIDRNNNTTTYAHSSGLLSTITDPLGRVTTFTYTSGELDEIEDWASRETTFTINGSGRLTAITAPDPDGGGSQTSPVTDITYHATSGLMTQADDPLDNTTSFDYDFAGRISEITFADTNTNDYSPVIVQGLVDLATSGSSGNPADLSEPADAVGTFTDGLTNVTSYEVNFRGSPTKVTDPNSNVRTMEYNTMGKITKLTKPDPDGAGPLGTQITQFAYTSGDLTQTTLPDSETLAFEYDSTFHLQKKATDELGRITVYTISGTNGNVTKMTQVIGEIDDQQNQETDDLDWDYTYTADPTTSTDIPGGMISTSTDPLGRVTKYVYETNSLDSEFGLLTSIEFADGTAEEVIVSFEYDTVGDMTAVIDGLSRRAEFTFDELGRLTKTKLPDPDDAGPLTSPEYTYAYDAAGNNTSETDPLSNATTYTFDSMNRVSKVTFADPDGGGAQVSPEIEYEYDAAGQMTKFIDALDNETVYSYDGLGRVDEVTLPDPDGAGSLTSPETTYTYDVAGNVTKVTDPLGNETSYTYDIRDRIIKTTLEDPDDTGPLAAPEFEYEYDDASQLTKVTDPLDRVTEYEYGDRGLTTKVILPDLDGVGGQDPPEILHEYDDVGNLVTVTDVLGNDTDYTYDKHNQVTKTTYPDPDGAGSQESPEIEYEYDAAGQVTKIIDALDNETISTFDDLGRVTKVTLPDPDGAGSEVSPEIEYEYDAAGNLLTLTDALNEDTDYTYDNLYRVTKIELPDPDDGGSLDRPETTYEYDASGNLTKLTDPVSNETIWSYDNLFRLTSRTDELSESRSYEYDAFGNLTKHTNREGLVIEYTYDDLNRLTQELWKDGATTENTLTFVYDAASQLTSASDDHSSYDYSYDEHGRVEQVDIDDGGPDVQLVSTWDAAGNRTKLTAHFDFGSGYKDDFKSTYTYDDLGRLTKIEQTDIVGTGSHSIADKRIDFEYNSSGQFTKITRYDDLAGGSSNEVAYTDFAYDDMGRLTDLTQTHDTTTVADYDYTLDAASRITQMDFTSSTGNDGVSDYTYDDTGQVTDVDHDFQTDETYTFDENGNRTVTGYTTGSDNRMTSNGTFNYTYDDEGNRLERSRISTEPADDYTTDYEWDHKNRLTKITYKDKTDAVTKELIYTYDVFGRRIKKSVDLDGAGAGSAVLTQYIYDDEHIVLALDGSDDITNRYLYGPAVDMILADEQVTSTTSDGDILWPLTDHLGSVRDILESDGTVANHITYDAFGNVTSETDDTVDHIFAFTGRERDEESDLQYNRARYYDPTVGAWISNDPIGFAAGDANLSRYVGNGSTNSIDPDGLAVRHMGFLYIAENAAMDLWYVGKANVLGERLNMTHEKAWFFLDPDTEITIKSVTSRLDEEMDLTPEERKKRRTHILLDAEQAEIDDRGGHKSKHSLNGKNELTNPKKRKAAQSNDSNTGKGSKKVIATQDGGQIKLTKKQGPGTPRSRNRNGRASRGGMAMIIGTYIAAMVMRSEHAPDLVKDVVEGYDWSEQQILDLIARQKDIQKDPESSIWQRLNAGAIEAQYSGGLDLVFF